MASVFPLKHGQGPSVHGNVLRRCQEVQEKERGGQGKDVGRAGAIRLFP